MIRGYPDIFSHYTKEGERTMMNEKMFRKVERLVATIGGRYFTVETESNHISINIFSDFWYEIFRSMAYLYNRVILAPIETYNKKFVLIDDFCGLDITKWETTIVIVDTFSQLSKETINKISDKDFKDYFIGD